MDIHSFGAVVAQRAALCSAGAGPFFHSFSAIFNRKMQELPLFSCILIRNEGKNGQALQEATEAAWAERRLSTRQVRLLDMLVNPALD